MAPISYKGNAANASRLIVKRTQLRIWLIDASIRRCHDPFRWGDVSFLAPFFHIKCQLSQFIMLGKDFQTQELKNPILAALLGRDPQNPKNPKPNPHSILGERSPQKRKKQNPILTQSSYKSPISLVSNL